MARRFQYSEEDMKNALSAVASGMPVSAASKHFKVPRTTLLYKYTGKYPIDRKIGPDTVLTKEKESLLVKWIFSVGDSGFPVTKTQLLHSTEQLLKTLKKPNNFTNGRPGRHWYGGFLRRYPEISLKVSQNLTQSRASVTEEKIRKWFSEIKEYLEKKKFVSNT